MVETLKEAAETNKVQKKIDACVPKKSPLYELEKQEKDIGSFDDFLEEQKGKEKSKEKANKNQDKIDDIVKERTSWNKDITDIQVEPKLKYINFAYKNKYTIKYEPNPRNGQAGSDIITVTDPTTKKSYEMEIGLSLFMKDREQKYKKPETHKEKLTERLDYVTKIFTIIDEKMESDANLVFNDEERVIIKSDKIYFATDRKITANGKENLEECFWKIEYQKAKKEGGGSVPEKYTITEIKQNTYFDNAYL